MNRSKLYDGLSEIERDQVSKHVSRISKQVLEFQLDYYKTYVLGREGEKLFNLAKVDKISWSVYHRLYIFLIDWVDNIARKHLGLN